MAEGRWVKSSSITWLSYSEVLAAAASTLPDKPFEKAVAEVIREYAKDAAQRPVNPPAGETQPVGGLDGSVKEEVVKSLGDLADKYDSKKPWPGSAS